MDTLYNSINKSLQLFIKGRNAKIEPPPADFKPLFLLLDIKPDLVCFSSLGENFEDDYLKGFTNFKNLYAISSNKWADYDLSLVFCKTIRDKITDEFCNKIELDPYFCRKFVIDAEKLDSEFSRLPFTPLYSENIVGLQRAPSAQTFLMRHNMKTDLAEYLVVPHLRGEERIIEDCYDKLFGEPEWSKGEKEEFISIKESDKSKIRIKSIEICNFRVYRESLKFDLDANLVVLYGPNGFGKTSFFDALDFVCTGSVGRFEGRGFESERIIKVLRHLDAPQGGSFVKAVLCKEDKDILLTRQMEERHQAYLNNNIQDRTKILMELVGLSEKPPDLRVDNLARLFRASHLFGQEFQTLTAEFKKDSRLPQGTVSSMLALQDYVEAIAKSGKVIEELKRKINEKDINVETLNASLRTYATEVDRLKQSAKIAENPEMIMLMGKKIAEELKQYIDISADISKEINRDIVLGWRAMLESEVTNSNQKIEALKEVKEKFEDYQRYNKNLREKNEELKTRKEQLTIASKDYAEREKTLEILKEKIKAALLEEKNYIARKDNLIWLIETKIENEKLKKGIQDQNNNCKRAISQLSEISSKLEKLKTEIGIKEKNISRFTIEIDAKKDKLNKLAEFKKHIAEYKKLQNEQKELEIYLDKSNIQIEDMKKDLRVKKSELNKILLEHNDLKQSIDGIQQSQTELQTLLDNIEKYVVDKTCPACGTVHKTKQDLIGKIQRQKGIRPQKLQDFLQSLQIIKDKMRLCKKEVNRLETKISQLTQETKSAQKELDDINVKIKAYKQSANSLGIDINDDTSNSVVSLEKNIISKINLEQEKLLNITTELKGQQEQCGLLLGEETKLKQALNSIEAKREQLQSTIEKNQEIALNKQLSLEQKKQSIQEDLNKIEDSLEKLRKQTKVLQDEDEILRKEFDVLLKKKNSLENEVANLSKEITEANKFVENMNNILRKWNLESDIDKLSLVKNGLSERVFNINSLFKEIINFEAALDSVQTSATLVNILKEMGNIKTELNKAEAEIATFKKWLLYFEDVNKDLSSVQKRSLTEYIDKYGPLSTAIQRRLRSAYGFKEIDLLQEKGGISVRISRKEQKNIIPSDYFSESQMQILMLSLFLSATLTQTWSAFAPILLDDPVTHFDDLNAYSLLDLIKGLIGGVETNSPQFIISTCEERLFRLMRQKFSGMKEKVIFYEFESLGEAGPKVKKL